MASAWPLTASWLGSSKFHSAQTHSRASGSDPPSSSIIGRRGERKKRNSESLQRAIPRLLVSSGHCRTVHPNCGEVERRLKTGLKEPIQVLADSGRKLAGSVQHKIVVREWTLRPSPKDLPVTTSDPTGADSMFSLDLNGIGSTPDVYMSSFAQAKVTPLIVATPEPFSMAIMVTVLACALMAQMVRRAQTNYHRLQNRGEQFSKPSP